MNLSNYLKNFKKLILTFFLIQILAGVAGTPVFAQDCNHWLKIVQVDKSVGGFFNILDDNGQEIHFITIPTGTDPVKAAHIIEKQIFASKIVTCFKRVGPYLCVDNVKRYAMGGALNSPGYKLVEVNRPDFVSKTDSVIATANSKTRWATEVLKINSDTEMYDSYTVDPISYGPKEPPFGNPSERKTNYWGYEVRLYKNIYKVLTSIAIECDTYDANADHFITVKLKVKKLAIKE